MDSLRTILLICGVVLLAGIYVWGVTVARRGSPAKRLDDPDSRIDDELELLERFQDSRAAQNAASLKELNEIDVDEELDPEPAPAAATVTQTPPEDRDDRAEHHEHDDHVDEHPERARFRPVFAEGVDADEDSGGDIGLEEKTDLVASLSEIRATLAPDPVTRSDQLDLLPKEEEQEKEIQRIREHESRRSPKLRPPAGREAAAESLVLAVTVMAKEGERFEGGDLRNWLEALKLRHGDMGIFHYRPPGKPLRSPPTFSVSSVIKPGSFDVEQMEDITVPGVALFVQLPGPDDPAAAFEEMLRAARKLAEGLSGVVCDETRSTLTGQAINHMRERLSEFSRKQRLRF